MLILIPILAGLLLYIDLSALQRLQPLEERSARKAFIETLIILGCFIALSSEILGIFHSINTLWVTVSWGILLAFNIILGLKKHLLIVGIKRLCSSIQLEGKIEYLFIALILIVLTLTFITGILSPPNTYDSFLYHMPRVAHWIQNSGLSHYGTAYINQLAFPIWAEEGIMTLWLFRGSDALSNTIQWLAYVGSILIVSYIAQLLGGSRKAQWMAAFFAMCIPTVILQSSSTQNDLVTGLWFLCFLAYISLSQIRALTWIEYIFCGCALGLGLLTKGTFYLYAFVFFLLLVLQILRKEKLKRGLLITVVVVMTVFLLNAGYWTRNMVTFKSPLGTANLIVHHVYGGTLPEVLLNPLRNLAVNLVTPSDELNHQLFGWMFNQTGDPSGALPPYGVVFSWNDEDYAGNPLQVLVILFAFIFLFIKHKKSSNQLWFYAIGLLESIIIFCLGLHYNPFINRLEIPFFLAAACVVGIVFDGLIKANWLKTIIILIFFLTALPWVLLNKTRPLIGLRANPEPLALRTNRVMGETKRSILIESKVVTFFARTTELMGPRIELMNRVESSGCKEIGLRVISSDPEYPYFWLLSAPLSGYRIESLDVMAETTRYLDPGFHPCAIICTLCNVNQGDINLDLVGKFGDATLYLNE